MAGQTAPHHKAGAGSPGRTALKSPGYAHCDHILGVVVQWGVRVIIRIIVSCFKRPILGKPPHSAQPHAPAPVNAVIVFQNGGFAAVKLFRIFYGRLNIHFIRKFEVDPGGSFPAIVAVALLLGPASGIAGSQQNMVTVLGKIIPEVFTRPAIGSVAVCLVIVDAVINAAR